MNNGTTPASKVMKVIHDHFSEEPEVYEVSQYITSSLTLDMLISIGIMGNKTEIPIPPEALLQVKRFDNGLTLNQFYLANFAPIKSVLTLCDIKFSTMNQYLAAIGQRKVEVSQVLPQIKAVLYTQFDALTTLAFLWKGHAFAEEFDRKIRMCVDFTPEQEIFFSKLETNNF